MRASNSVDIVFNCATNVVGGAVQNAVHFINEVIKSDYFGFKWYFILSPQVYTQVKENLRHHSYNVIAVSPATSLQARIKLQGIVRDVNPRLVYSSAGPAYVTFKATHVMGCSNPYILGASEYSYGLYGGWLSQLKIKLRTFYQKIKEADVWITQTESSAESLKEIVGHNVKIHIVYNSISEEFLSYFKSRSLASIKRAEFRKNPKILIPTAYYKHKDLEKVPLAIAKYIEKYNSPVEVNLTIGDDNVYQKILDIAHINGVDKYFSNLGVYEHNKALEIYLAHDVILQPSVLEVFSTSYIESMSIFRPLVVPRFSFSESICGDYAHYYDCNDLDSYAKAIYEAITSYNAQDTYFKSIGVVEKYGSQQQRTAKIVDILTKIMNEDDNFV